MHEIIKSGIVLFCISFVASLSLGFANEITREPIRLIQKKLIDDSYRELLEDATEFKFIKKHHEPNNTSYEVEIYEALKENKVIGWIFLGSTQGYGGLIDISIGVDATGYFSGIKILKHSETPGLGANITKQNFTDQFKNMYFEKKLELVKNEPNKDNQIHAITSATISSNAIVKFVNHVQDLYFEIIKL